MPSWLFGADEKLLPKFNDFEPSAIDIRNYAKDLNFNGNPESLKFKTLLEEEFSKSKYVPNFANYYRLVEIDCGVLCQKHFLIDIKTGNIYNAPRSSLGVQFRFRSALLITEPNDNILEYYEDKIPENAAREFYTSYFVWDEQKKAFSTLIDGPKEKRHLLNSSGPITINSQPLPKFTSYPLNHVFGTHGKGLDFNSNPEAKHFKTEVTREFNEKTPTFGGHYRIASWGCGTSCQQHLLIDLENGKIYDVPGSGLGIKYKLTSTLLIKNPHEDILEYYDDEIPEDGSRFFYTSYFAWDEQKKKFIILFDEKKEQKAKLAK